MASETVEQDISGGEGVFDHLIKQLIEKLDSTFKIIEKCPDFFKYQVSHKETLILSTFSDKGDSDYRFTLKCDLENPKITFEGGIFYTENSTKTFNLSSDYFQEKIRTLAFFEQNVNPDLMLFACSNEERFVKGNLEQWDRIDGMIIAKADLGELLTRRKQWENDHPRSSERNKHDFKEYPRKHCRKAKCIHFENGKCAFGMLPTNQKDQIKLKFGGTGYCQYYKNFDMIILELHLLNKYGYPLLMKRMDFFANIRSMSRELKKLTPDKHEFRDAKPFFSREKLASLMELVKSKLPKKKQFFLKHFKDNLIEFRSQFYQTTIEFRDFMERKVQGRAYKKARNDFKNAKEELFSSTDSYSQELNHLVNSIQKQNTLIKQLFKTGTPVRKRYSFNSMKKGMIVYFPFAESTERKGFRTTNKTSEHLNVGRIKYGEEWADYPLSPLYRGTDYHVPYRKRARQPLFEVIKVRKSEIELRELYKPDRFIRLLNTREYIAERIKFTRPTSRASTGAGEKYPETVKKVVKQSTLADFF